MSKGSLSQEQIAAMRISAEIGRKLQVDFPEIADDYRNGMTQEKIVIKYNLESLYETSRRSAIVSVSNALRGYDARWYGSYYFEGLIPADEMNEINRQRQIERGHKNGLDIYRRKKAFMDYQTKNEQKLPVKNINKEKKTGQVLVD